MLWYDKHMGPSHGAADYAATYPAYPVRMSMVLNN